MRISNAVHDKQIVDESTLSGTQYLNILVGSLKIPLLSYLYDCQPLKCAPNSNIIAHTVDDAVRNVGSNRSFFCLLLSNAAKYVIAAGTTLKPLYPKLFHVTCVAHLLHKFAMNIKSHFENVDQLIAKVKAVTNPLRVNVTRVLHEVFSKNLSSNLDIECFFLLI